MNDVDVDNDERLAGLLEIMHDESLMQGCVDAEEVRWLFPKDADEVLPLLEMIRRLEGAANTCREAAHDTVGKHRSGQPETERSESALTPSPEKAGSPIRPEVPALLGRYRIVARINGGGMGDVYKAEDPLLGRLVAVKVPRFDGSEEVQVLARQRFVREARAAAAVRHTHVCQIHDVGEQDGTPYAVMDYVDGQSLADRLQAQGRYADCREAARLVRQVAQGLAAVHAVGLIHRDIKPGNILLDKQDHPLLTDFGLARPEQDAERLTADGALVGTVPYMPPEMVTPTERALTSAADIYSLGVVLYQMVTGRTPYQGSVLILLQKIAQEEPPPPTQFRPDLDPGLQAIIMKAMVRLPEERFANAQAFADALGHWYTGAGRNEGRSDQVGHTPVDMPNPRPAAVPPPLPFLESRDSTFPERAVPDHSSTASDVVAELPPVRRRKRAVFAAVGGAVVLIAAAVVVWVYKPPQPLGSMGSTQPAAPVIPPGLVKYRGSVDLYVYRKDDANADRLVPLWDPRAMPLRPGDQLRLIAEVHPPAFVYVFWIDEKGEAAPAYPWRFSEWGTRPPAEQPTSKVDVKWPGGEALKIEGANAGTETVLMLARPTKLDADDTEVKKWFKGLPAVSFQGDRSKVWFEDFDLVTGDRDRAVGKGENVDGPRGLQAELRLRIGPEAGWSRAVSFSRRGDK